MLLNVSTSPYVCLFYFISIYYKKYTKFYKLLVIEKEFTAINLCSASLCRFNNQSINSLFQFDWDVFQFS